MNARTKEIQSSIQKKLQVICHAALALVMVMLLCSCSRRYNDLPPYWPIPFREYDNQSVGRFKTSYLAEQIDDYYQGANPGPIGVTTFVSLDDLYTTSSFGRMLAEQLMSELTMRGYDVVELRQGDALRFMRDGGEFSLSRERGAVRATRDLGGVVVGTYVSSPQRVYVNARLLHPATSMVLSAGSVEMDRTKEIGKLLKVGGVPAALERIPVKHLTLGDTPLNLSTQQGKYYDWEETNGPFSINSATAPRPEFAPSHGAKK